MKRFLSAIIFMALSVCVFAQVTITSSNYYQPGSAVRDIYIVENDAIDSVSITNILTTPLSFGNSLESQFGVYGIIDSVFYADPETEGEFIEETCSFADENGTRMHLKITNEKAVYLGISGTSPLGLIDDMKVKFDEPMDIISFPATLNSQTNSTAHGLYIEHISALQESFNEFGSYGPMIYQFVTAEYDSIMIDIQVTYSSDFDETGTVSLTGSRMMQGEYEYLREKRQYSYVTNLYMQRNGSTEFTISSECTLTNSMFAMLFGSETINLGEAMESMMGVSYPITSTSVTLNYWRADDYYPIVEMGTNPNLTHSKYLAIRYEDHETSCSLSVNSNDSNMGYVSGGGNYPIGSQATISATPYNGYRFVKWNDDNTDNPRTITVTGNATYIANFEAIPVQYTITVLSANETMGYVSGGGTFYDGNQRTISATPYSGYRFVRWNDGNTSNPRTITVTGNATYIASFEALPEQYTITVLSANETMGYVSGGGTFYDGDQITISATPYAGYRFVRWNDGNIDNPRTITVTGNTTYIANFEAIPVQYTITVLSASETMGSVTGGGNYYGGSQTTISATPNEGYRFIGWNDNNTDNPRTITVTGNAIYIASFEELPAQYTITVLSASEIMGSVTGGGVFYEGAQTTISATPNEGNRFVGWNDNNTDNPRTITVTGDATYIASFEVNVYYSSFTAEACGVYTWNEQTYTESGEYQQAFTTANSADSIVTLTLTIHPLPQPEITASGALDGCNPSPITLSAGDYSTYNWSTGATTATISISEPGYYYVEVIDENGCTGISEQVNIGLSDALAAAPQISVVGMNSVNHNVIAWSALNDENVNAYRIYRENNVANVYESMATVEASQTTWTDETADPSARAYRYKITAVDECGGESPMSEYHKTMHLTINQGIGSTWNLIWSHYEGFDFGTYRIYRGTMPSNMTMIGEVPSNLNSYTDNTAEEDEGFYYQVEVIRNTRSRDAEISSRSNIVDNGYLPEFTITAMATSPSRGTVTGGGTYLVGTVVTLTAIANEGYEFATWDDESTDNPRTITVTGNATYIASFDEISTVPEYTITVMSANPNRGMVTGDGTYPEGTVVTIEATAFDGFEFVSWSDENTENPRQITVTGDATYIATFEEIQSVTEYTITVMSSNPNRGTVTGGGTYPAGAVVTIEAIANEGSEFESWSDGDADNPRQITVSGDATYIASFIPATSIEETSAFEIVLFPNPATDILNITSSETISEIEIVNVMGQVVRRIEVNSDNAVCNVEDLTSGVYVVRIRTEGTGVTQRKFIKE